MGGQTEARNAKNAYFADILPTCGHTKTGSNPVCSTKKNSHYKGFAGSVHLIGCQFGAVMV